MILNNGLDRACEVSGTSSNLSSSGWPSCCRFISYSAYGNGTTPPQVTDMDLENELGRARDNGGFGSGDWVGTLDYANDLVRYEATFPRVHNFENPVDITEWGLSEGATSNINPTMSVRDLLREDINDPNSAPVTLQMQAGDQLRFDVTLVIEVHWVLEPAQIIVSGAPGKDGNGTFDGLAGPAVTSESNVDALMITLWPGGGSVTFTRFTILVQDTIQGKDESASRTGFYDSDELPYTEGDYYRDYEVTLSTGSGNFTHYGWQIAASNSYGFRFWFTDPATFEKVETHELTMSARKTIARLGEAA